MSVWNGQRFSIYDQDEMQALGLIDKLGGQTNYNTDSLEGKTDKTGDHQGTWCGYKPTQVEPAFSAILEGHEERLKNLPNDIICLRQYVDVNAIGDTALLQSAINYCATNNYKLYIDKTINLTATLNIPSNSYIFSNKSKYKIYTTSGTSLNGMILAQAYNANNIIVESVSFENTGYGQSGSSGIAGEFTGFGAGLCFGGCTNITVSNCNFFKCGGYNYGEGCAQLWFSCCHNVLAEGNICTLGDNGIIVDRWFASKVGQESTYNSGIIITNNRITQMSGRCIVVENSNNQGDIILSDNIMQAFGVTGFEGRDFRNTTINGNVINGDYTLKVNPSIAYGLVESGWNWSSYITANGYNGLQIINTDNNVLIGNNVFSNLRETGCWVGNNTKTTIVGNTFENIVNDITNSTGVSFACTSIMEFLKVDSNVFNNVGRGMYIGNSGGTPQFTTVDNNIFKVMTTGVYVNCNLNALDINNNLIKMSNTDINNTYGVKLGACTNVSMGGNHIYGFLTGIRLDGTVDIVIRDTLTDNSNHVYLNSVSNANIQSVFIRGVNCLNGAGTVTGNALGSKFIGYTTLKAFGMPINVTINQSTYPTTGYWAQGDITYNTTPTAGGTLGWVCTTGGNGGVWKTFGTIQA